VIADAEDNIGYQMSGLMPKRCDGWNGFEPRAGWDSANDWLGVVDTADLPQAYNPESGFIVTANQDLNHLGKACPINMPMGNYRATRIEEVLASHQKHDLSTMTALQMDVYSKQASLFLDILFPLLEEKGEKSPCYHALTCWDHCYDLDSKGATIFEAFYRLLRKEVFGLQKMGMGKDVIDHLSNDTGLFIDFYQNFDQVLLAEDSVWYRDLSRDEAFLIAFEKLKAENLDLNLTWGEQNTIEMNNIVFQGKLPTVLGFDTEAIPFMGGRATPHQGQVYRSAGRNTSFGPSVRLVAEMGEACLHTCLAGGPSDSRFSVWYKSGLNDWLEGRYKKLEAR
jgi:penicillin amidase